MLIVRLEFSSLSLKSSQYKQAIFKKYTLYTPHTASPIRITHVTLPSHPLNHGGSPQLRYTGGSPLPDPPAPRCRGAAMAAEPQAGRSALHISPQPSQAFTSHQRAVAFYVIHTSLCNVNYLHQGCPPPPHLSAVSRQVKKCSCSKQAGGRAAGG